MTATHVFVPSGSEVEVSDPVSVGNQAELCEAFGGKCFPAGGLRAAVGLPGGSVASEGQRLVRWSDGVVSPWSSGREGDFGRTFEPIVKATPAKKAAKKKAAKKK
jgi:hypothetical protein